MNLHDNLDLFIQSVKFTAEKKEIQNIYVEKDYWITLALYSIFSSSLGKDVIFKGGTSLSKCYNIIERFSEDIDLVLLRKESDSPNQLKSKLKKISIAVSNIMPEVQIDNITNKKGMIRKTAHNYPKVFKGEFGQVRSDIIVESTWLGYFEPYTTKTISSMISEMMLENGQEQLIKQYDLEPFRVLVLDINRTLCEKIMSLVRFSHTDDAITDLNNKIRHIYDIDRLLKNEAVKRFFYSENFDLMLSKVANDDVKSFKNNNSWLKSHPSKSLIFANTKDTWKQLTTTYQTNFKYLVYGIFPKETEILNTLNEVAERLQKIKWDISIT